MTINHEFETMSSNYVCNEAFSEGNQTGSSLTPELPIFSNDLKTDEEYDMTSDQNPKTPKPQNPLLNFRLEF